VNDIKIDGAFIDHRDHRAFAGFCEIQTSDTVGRVARACQNGTRMRHG
jgi:hypothetical protein